MIFYDVLNSEIISESIEGGVSEDALTDEERERGTVKLMKSDL